MYQNDEAYSFTPSFCLTQSKPLFLSSEKKNIAIFLKTFFLSLRRQRSSVFLFPKHLVEFFSSRAQCERLSVRICMYRPFILNTHCVLPSFFPSSWLFKKGPTVFRSSSSPSLVVDSPTCQYLFQAAFLTSFLLFQRKGSVYQSVSVDVFKSLDREFLSSRLSLAPAA